MRHLIKRLKHLLSYHQTGSTQIYKESCFYKPGWTSEERGFFNRESKSYVFRSIMTFFSTNQVKGHYFEFGCCGAHTMRIAYDHTKILRPDMFYYGFDSFEGFPQLDELDRGHWKKGDLAMSEHKFRRICTGYGMPAERLVTLKGLFSETLSGSTREHLSNIKAAIVYIDVDVYSSTASVLEFVHTFFTKGTVIVFDDWNCFYSDDTLGERRAWKEFIERHSSMRFTPFVSTHMAQSFIYLGNQNEA